MIILNNKFAAVILLLIFINLILVKAEIRPLDGQSNNKDDPKAGTPQSQLTRNIGKTSWPDASGNAMASTPGEYTIDVPKNTLCVTPLPKGQLPLPRCVSDLVNGLQSKLENEYNLNALEAKKAKRKTSHMVTFWGQFASLDIVNTVSTGENLAIYIPPDDSNFNSQYFVGPSNQPLTDIFLPFNRTTGPIRNGINRITSFLDGSLIYGVTDAQLSRVRDKESGLGKFKLNYVDSDDGRFGYPLIDGVTGEYIFAISDHKGKNVFLNTILLIFMREHNRKCDELYLQHKNQWSDEDYFQEARRWVIAIIQRITYLEYLSVLLGTPLPTYSGYDASLVPSIDSFFATVTSRYGHSELSDVYDIVNKDGYKLAELPLNALQVPNLIENYGVPTLILSMALQRQEEIDIFFADQMRAFRPKVAVQDIASLDIVRGRDRGVPLYNDAREAFDLVRASRFSEISQDQEVQNRLQSTYGNVDLVESFIGGLAEPHLQGSLLGPLFHASVTQQWTLIRNSDRFWFEGTDAGFTAAEIDEIRNTTLLSVIQRNTPSYINYPTNLWSVQPLVTFNATNEPDDKSDYPPQNVIKFSEVYEVRWVIKADKINLKLTMSSTNSWFGIGFNPLDTGMFDADMIVIWNKNDSTLYVKDYKSNGYKKPEVAENQIVTVLSQSTLNGVTQVEISRPLNAPNRRPIPNSMITLIYAWNPNSMEFSYHGGNRGATKVNFFSGETSAEVLKSNTLTQLIHGIAMFIVWGILFPASIFIVRYLKHIDSYMSQHRNLQMLGGLIVITFGAAAMATVPQHGRNAHGVCGLLVYFTLFIQIGLGILAIWGLATVESASTGIVVGLKHLHFYLGVSLLFLSWVQIYLGLRQYGSVQAVNVLYLCWLAILVIMIVVSEYVYKYKNMQFLWPVRETGDKNRRLHNCIPEDVYEQLPAISWNDFNLRVMAGAHLVVAEGLVFDIHKWIKIHPGGQRILRRVIGTDITNDFFFDPADQIVINRAFSENEKLMKQMEDVETSNKNIKKKKTNQTTRPKTIANAIDLINSTTFKNSRVAMHRHSKFATSKLATMVVARISDISDEYSQHKKDDIGTLTNTTLTNMSQDSSPYIFRRYILTNIELATRHDAENRVKKLTFQVLHPKDKLPKFFPGDYIEIMSYVNKHVVIRPYTPLQGPTDKTFTILVKVYNDGAMSQHLDKQLRNFEIAVRGPFDIAERMSIQSSTNVLPTSPTIGPTSPNLVRRGTTTLMRQNSVNNVVINPHHSYQPSNFGLDSVFGDESRSLYGTISNSGAGQSRILLNPARGDQCWDTLFMVCGGTGLTPMLQLIQYHFDNADNFKSNFKLHLLCANTQIADIISMKYLDFLASTSDGKLTVTHILTKPPPIWRGLTGHIDEDILFNWISKNYQVPPPAIPPRINVPTTQPTNNYQVQNPSQNSLQDPSLQPQMLLTTSYSPPPIVNNYPTAPTPPPIDDNYNWQMRRDTLPFAFSSNEMSILSERQEFMRMLSQDTTQACKVIVCGPYGMMDAVRRSLERIGFPVDTKVLFIQ